MGSEIETKYLRSCVYFSQDLCPLQSNGNASCNSAVRALQLEPAGKADCSCAGGIPAEGTAWLVCWWCWAKSTCRTHCSELQRECSNREWTTVLPRVSTRNGKMMALSCCWRQHGLRAQSWRTLLALMNVIMILWFAGACDIVAKERVILLWGKKKIYDHKCYLSFLLQHLQLPACLS